MAEIKELVGGLDFGEGPRWHDGRLWYSDFFQQAVYAVDPSGSRETIVKLDDQPSGLGWLTDGTLLIVSMTKRAVLRFDGEALSLHADLSNIAAFHCNDMVVDKRGHAYVGNLGFDIFTDGPQGAKPAKLAHITPDGTAQEGADGLIFPNGSVVTGDGSTLIVGESLASRYTAFDISEDGSLSNGRTWAQLDGYHPDGCTLDAQGAIWFADPGGSRVVRVEEGGTVTDEIEMDQPPWACILGGPDGRTLFILTAPGFLPEQVAGKGSGRISTTTVDQPHAGMP
jgi:sugar lactone lactonase YvrE